MNTPTNSLCARIYLFMCGAWRQRYTIVISIILMPILSIFAATLTPKHYQSHTSMLIQETSKMNPFLQDFSVSAMLKERMAALQTLLHSRHILGAVAKERGFIDDYSSAKEYEQAIEKLSQSLTLTMAGKDLIRIDFEANTPEGIKETLNVISHHFIEQLLAPERSSMKDSTRFLATLLTEREAELIISEQHLADYKNRNATELPELHSSNVSRLTQLQKVLAEKQSELAGAKKNLGGLNLQLSKTNPVIGRLEEQIVNLKSQLAILRASYTDKHSKVQGIIRQLTMLESERQQSLSQDNHTINSDQLWDIANTVSINSDSKQSQPLLISQLENLQMARSKVTSLQEEVIRLKELLSPLLKQINQFGEHERLLIQLERDISVKLELYNDLAKRFEMAKITSSLGDYEQEKRIKIIDLPFTPGQPTNLSLLIYLLIGLFSGTALGSGLALLIELSDSTIRRKSQILAITGKPTLARIPPINTQLFN